MKIKYLFILIILYFQVYSFADSFTAYSDYEYDPNDFAVEWIDYHHNGMYYDWLNRLPMINPENALGRPSVDTTGDDDYISEDKPVPVNPVYPAFRYNELLYLGEGGYITVKFSHQVRDDENNKYGIDLNVFGNSTQVIGGATGWAGANPNLVTVGGGGFIEPGIVSVSQDGEIWYSFTNDADFMKEDPNFIKLPSDLDDGPFCDGFAPTLGRVYTDEPNRADASIGSWNKWWAEPANPTLPMDPNLDFDSFDGYTVAEICEVYGNSAGGTGYDISILELPVDPKTGKKWFQYVRVDDRANGGNAEIDAFADVSCCGDWKHPYPTGDITKDCRVDLNDFSVMAGYWLSEVAEDDVGSEADLVDNEYVDISDLQVLAIDWLECSWDCS